MYRTVHLLARNTLLKQDIMRRIQASPAVCDATVDDHCRVADWAGELLKLDVGGVHTVPLRELEMDKDEWIAFVAFRSGIESVLEDDDDDTSPVPRCIRSRLRLLANVVGTRRSTRATGCSRCSTATCG